MQIESTSAANELLATMRALIAKLDQPEAERLWAAEDIARYMGLSKGSVQTHILSKTGFPKPVILASGGRRWVPAEVKAWTLRHR